MKVYVDDFMMIFSFDTNKTTKDQIVTRVKGAYVRLSEQIRKAGGNFAAGKGKAVATNHDIATLVAKALNCCTCSIGDPTSDKCRCTSNHRIKPLKDLVMLGVDYSAGRPVSYAKNMERMASASDKARKILSLGKGGPFLLNVMRAHVQTAALYGARVNGINNGTLEKLRTIVRAASSTRAHGGSATMDLHLQKQKDIDPAYAGNTLPLLQWATRINVASWNNDQVTLVQHSKAWAAAMANMAKCLEKGDDPWRNIIGPASACIATLGRIGWDVPQAFGWKQWIDREGVTIDLTVTCPYSLKKSLHRDIARQYWSVSMLNEQISDRSGVWLEPLRSAIFTAEKQKGAMTRSAAIGTQWTQSRVAEAGYATSKEDVQCKLCHDANGTLEHRFASDGCPYLQTERNQWITNADDAIVCEMRPKLLVTHGFLLNSERPTVDWKPVLNRSAWYESDNAIHRGDIHGTRKTFTGDTFVDGSCVACKENDELTQCGWAVVSMRDNIDNEAADLAEQPDPDGPRCTCRYNNNPYHKCVPQCSESSGCDGKCRTKRHDQSRPRAPVDVAIWGVLPGVEQTTPRAELYAILQALTYGKSPQGIFCDHINHVNMLNDWMYYGVTSFLNPKTPNLDLWRKVYVAINRRGGLCPSGSQQLSFIWQPSHTRACDRESVEEKLRRRGNDAADYFANKGRELHRDISDIVEATKQLFDRAKSWALWLGHASYLQYAHEWKGCDHDIKPKGHMAKPKSSKQDVHIPREAKVIRRLPWARTSLGTIEFLDDLWVQQGVNEHPESSDSSGVQRITMAVSKHGTTAERAYQEQFSRHVLSGEPRRGVRYIPRQVVPELSETLPTSASLGHHMMTAGVRPQQFFWCELCSAYTGQRVRKLVHECDRVSRSVPAVEALRKGRNPYTDTALDTRPRRLCKRDVGSYQWSGEGRPDDNVEVCSVQARSYPGDDLVPLSAVVVLASQHADEDL